MSRLDEKEQLVDLNERFQAYVRRVRRLKDESDIQSFYRSIGTLEEEVKVLRTSYESQISKLKYTVDVMTKEKAELERVNITKKNSEAHLTDRLTVELNKNQKIVDELNQLHKIVMQKDEEIKTLNKTLSQAWFDFNVAQKDFQDSLKHADELQVRLDESESNRQGKDEKIKLLEDKVAFQERLSEERVTELRTRLEGYVVQVAQLDNRVEEANRKESELPELVRKIKEAAENEVKQFQRESEAYYKDTIYALQNQLESGDNDSRRLQAEMDRITAKLTESRKQESEYTSQITCLEQKNKILEQTIETERHHSNETIAMLERKLRDLQELMMTRLKESNLAERAQGLSLHEEIQTIQELLSEEERRLSIGTQSARRHLAGPHVDPPAFGLHRSLGLADLSATGAASFSATAAATTSATAAIATTSTAAVAATTAATAANSSAAAAASGEEEVGEAREKEVEVVKEQQHLEALEIEELAEAEAEEDAVPQTPRSPVGPVVAPALAVGPVRAAKPVTNGEETAFREYFDEMFATGQRRSRPASAGSHRSVGSATGDIRILEVNAEGRFVRLWNSSDDKEFEFGEHVLQQNLGGHPVAVYRFPPGAKFPANSTITVWAGCNDPKVHRPPTDFLWTEKYRWGAGPETTTILCRPSGQAMAWTTAPHRIARDPFHTPSERLFDSPTGPVAEEQKLPELPPVSRPEPVYLKRYRDKMDPVYAAVKHPHGAQPKASVHPNANTSRSKALGNDNSSLNRQTRLQTTVPDPVPGEPYAGAAYQRIGSARVLKFYPATLRGSGAIANKAPEVVLRSCAEPPSAFQKPRSRFQAGLVQIRSMHDLEHQPPMPLPPLFSQW